MKSGWRTKTIGEVCEVVNGGTPKTGVPEYWNGIHLWITPAEMGKRQSPFVADTERKISELGLQNSSARMLPPNSVILSSRAPIGHLVINTQPMATNQGCKGLIPTNGIQTKFLYYYLISIVDVLDSMGSGATFRELSVGKLKQVRVPAPPSNEQQRIVGILDGAIEGIATAKAKAEKNLQNARALFESHLQSVFAKRGIGWADKPLGEVCEVKDGTHNSPSYVADGIPFVTQKNIREEGLSFEKTKFISQEDHQDFWRRSNAAQGDILISMIGANRGMVCVVNDERTFSIKNVGLVKQNRSVNQQFLLYFLKSPQAASYVQGASKGGAQEFVGLTELRRFPVPLPPLKQQDKLAERFQSLRAETQPLASLYRHKLTTLEALKKSLLHQAFTGKL
jgi:type I restriction enzyme S subunit